MAMHTQLLSSHSSSQVTTAALLHLSFFLANKLLLSVMIIIIFCISLLSFFFFPNRCKARCNVASPVLLLFSWLNKPVYLRFSFSLESLITKMNSDKSAGKTSCSLMVIIIIIFYKSISSKYIWRENEKSKMKCIRKAIFFFYMYRCAKIKVQD